MTAIHCLTWDDLPETSTPQGVAKRRLTGAGLEMVRLAIPAGTEAGRHEHPHEQMIHVVSGSGWIETEQGRTTFAPGSLFHFPAGVWHAARFEAPTVLVEVNLTAG